jgi:hypothetical protein
VARCEFCGETLAFGSKRTAQNAMKLKNETFALAHMVDVMKEVLSESGEVSEDEMSEMEGETTKMIEFIEEAQGHALMKHPYAHSPHAPQPDWARAGFWSRRANECAEDLWPKLPALRSE